MNKQKQLVVYSKSKQGWNLYIAGEINQSVIGLSTKEQARYILQIIKNVYMTGRNNEFKDNIIKTNKLMERFGL